MPSPLDCGSTGPRAGLELKQLGQDALGSWPIVVLAAAFGVEVESAARAASEGVAQLIPGPEGNSALGLVQERVRRANPGIWLVAETSAGEHVNHLGCAGGSLGPEASDARGDDLSLPGWLGA